MENCFSRAQKSSLVSAGWVLGTEEGDSDISGTLGAEERLWCLPREATRGNSF